MRSMRWLVVGVVAGAAAVAAAAALAAGPWPVNAAAVTAPSGTVRYTTARSGFSTKVTALRVSNGATIATRKVEGVFGIPAVTLNGTAGGLSPNGGLLVLGEQPDFNGLRARTTFVVLSTRGLKVRDRVVLRGDFGYDALSPDGRTLYLIEHISMNPIHYAVRAYDLRAKRLVPGAIVDKREPGEKMTGYPVSRATSRVGNWVYTLYMRQAGEPFVHALNAANRTAFCIDVPWTGSEQNVWKLRLRLDEAAQRLEVLLDGKAVATVNTKTLAVAGQ
jgi:hypothetical protein